MPSKRAADLEEALSKKGGLTLSQLANYDDIITDALVDHVYFWSKIRKLKANYHACRAINEDKVCQILQKHAILNKDPAAAHTALLEQPGITRYYKSLRTLDEREHFERHLRKYVNIYLPDCPFEVDTTNRYTIMTAEACIKARRPIHKGEPIKYLSGIQVEMSEREEKELSSRTDFSIVLSSRRKRPSLFLGPARFANHDCNSNAKLNTSGPHGIHIVAVKDIEVDDEITVRYGEDYFGVDNCECLCATCEEQQRNGWDPRGPLLAQDDSDDSEEDEDAEEEEERAQKSSAAIQCRTSPRGKLPSTKVSPQKPARLADQSHSSASLWNNKRKREEDDASAPLNPVPRKRGRPRKYPRPDPPVDLESTNLANGDNVEPAQRFDSVTGSVQPPDVVEKVLGLLTSFGDRKRGDLNIKGRIAGGQIRKPHAMRPSLASKFGFDDEIEVGDARREAMDSHRDGRLTSRNSTSSSPSKLHYSASTPNLSTGLDGGRSRLQPVKKEQHFSTLRHVINVDEADPTDIYSVSATPDPPSHHPQQQSEQRESNHRNPPSKPTAPEDPTESTGPSSPSSFNADSASQTSQISSATSADVIDSSAGHENAFSSSEKQVEDDPEDEEPTPKAHPSIQRSLRARPTPATMTTSQTPSPSPSFLPSIELQQQSTTTSTTSTSPTRGPPRKPNDYTLTLALLTTPYHRWVECRNCDDVFVQSDAYQTRIACPRCERHSKLYGFHWPKTDYEGKFDSDQRVLDHRTIHRFIEPEMEKEVRKGRGSLVGVMKEREKERERSEGFEGSGDEVKFVGRGKRNGKEEILKRVLRNSPREGRRRLGSRLTM